MNSSVPYLSYDDIKVKAEEFLKKYHPSRNLPIPIDDIIEFGLKLDIVPCPELFKIHARSGFLTLDRSAIWVDQFQLEYRYKIFRFTLAHEVGHYVLHEDFYNQHSVSATSSSVEEYIKWQNSIPESVIGLHCTQANKFAGILLVPTPELNRECQRVVLKYSKELNEIYRGFTILPEDAWVFMSNEIAKSFEVNPIVVQIRIEKEAIAQSVTLPSID